MWNYKQYTTKPGLISEETNPVINCNMETEKKN